MKSFTRHIVVHNDIQDRYEYDCVAPIGADFDPKFKPDFTPAEMLEHGVFDGNYLDGHSTEFPREWFTHAKITSANTQSDPKLNYFGVHASQSLETWQNKGWIHKDDPRGWFEWYCRYFLGRRMPTEDARQIKRWKAIARHLAQIRAHCRSGDVFCRPRQRQAVLHWAYDSTKI